MLTPSRLVLNLPTLLAFACGIYASDGHSHAQVNTGQTYVDAKKRDSTISVGAWTFFGQTPDQISSMLDLHNARLLTIRAEDPLRQTFSGSMVANAGIYTSSWWWYYGFNGTGLGNLLDGRTLISLDPYQNSNGLVFVAIMIPNVGTEAISWWWWYGFNASGINDHLVSNNARLISARPYLSTGQVVYAVIMVSNAVDPQRWQWLTGQSISNISTTMNNNEQRILSLALNPGGGWDVVLVAASGERWWWWTELDMTAVTNSINAHDSLLVDLTSYTANGVRLYAGIELGENSSNSSSQSHPPVSSTSSSGITLLTSPTNKASHSHGTITTQTRVIIIGSVCGGIAVLFLVLILSVLIFRGRGASKTTRSRNHSTPSKMAPSSITSPTGFSTGTSNTVTPGGQSMIPAVVQQVTVPATLGTIEPYASPSSKSDSASPPSTSGYQYGYVPPTDPVFNVSQR